MPWIFLAPILFPGPGQVFQKTYTVVLGTYNSNHLLSTGAGSTGDEGVGVMDVLVRDELAVRRHLIAKSFRCAWLKRVDCTRV